MRQTILLVDDDRDVTHALSLVLECPGRTVIACPDLESAEIALDRFAVTHIVSDVQFSGPFSFEGLHFLGRMREKAPDCPIVLMTGHANDLLRRTAVSNGASAVLGKPFEIDELEALLGAPSSDEPFNLLLVPSIEDILASGKIGTAFQPIVTADGEAFAFEALARVHDGWPLGGPAELFDYAVRRGRSVQLNRLAVAAAIEAAAGLPESALLFINVDPPAFSDAHLVDDVVTTAARAGVALDRIVLEITERASLIDDAISTDTFESLRTRGVRFALDDHGSAYSHLPTISTIKPSFIKISGVFGTGFETNADKKRVVRHVVALAHDFGCAAVLEGIETRATADAAADLGIELAQGYFFSVPREVSHWRGAAA